MSFLDDPTLSPRERFEILFGERTESQMKFKTSDSVLWMTLLESFLARMDSKRVSPVYRSNAARVLRRFTDFRNLWNARLIDITQTDLDAYIASRSRESISAVTVNNEVSFLNSIFCWCGPKLNVRGHRENLGIAENPPYARKLDAPEPIPISVTIDQLAKFVDATKLAKSPRRSVCDPERFWVAVLLLDSITALRRGALLNVPRPDDQSLLVKRQIVIPSELMKNRRAEVISLGTRDDVVQLLASLPSIAGEPLLPWKCPAGNRLSLSHFNATMKRFQVAAGIPPEFALRTKHLRSTAATEILSEQYSTDTARKRLGHKSEGVIRKHYQARIVTDADRSASDHLAARVMSLVK